MDTRISTFHSTSRTEEEYYEGSISVTGHLEREISISKHSYQQKLKCIRWPTAELQKGFGFQNFSFQLDHHCYSQKMLACNQNETMLMLFGFLAFITASDWNAIASNFCFFFWAHVKRHLVAIVWNLSTLSLNVFLQVGIAEFLGKEKPRGSLLPFPRRLAQRRHTARHGRAAVVGKCTTTTPRLVWNVSHPLCLVTMCYNVLHHSSLCAGTMCSHCG